MNLDTTRLNEQAQDVALDLMRAMNLTKDEAFIYMIESAARCFRKSQRVEYDASRRDKL